MAGRHRSFDKDVVLETVMKVFWQNGYAGTSMSDLTGATGLTKPSLYAAYGNKEELFRQSLHRYVLALRENTRGALRAPDLSLKDRIANYLRASVQNATDPSAPGGCFLLASTCEAGSEAVPPKARQTINEINATGKSAITEFLLEQQAKGHLAAAASAELLAGHLLVLQSGLVSMAQKGADLAELERLIDHAIAALPLGEPSRVSQQQ